MMSITRPPSLLARAALAAVATFAASAAHAAIYTGSWDPAYGYPFPSLGWTAGAVFDIPDSCLALGNGSYTTCPTGSFAFVSAQVSFYDVSDLSQTPLETFQIANPERVTGAVAIVDNKVEGVTSVGFFAPFVPTGSGAAGSIDGAGAYSFNLILQAGKAAQLYYGPPSGVPANCQGNTDNGNCGKSALAASGTIALAMPVPEPATTA